MPGAKAGGGFDLDDNRRPVEIGKIQGGATMMRPTWTRPWDSSIDHWCVTENGERAAHSAAELVDQALAGRRGDEFIEVGKTVPGCVEGSDDVFLDGTKPGMFVRTFGPAGFTE